MISPKLCLIEDEGGPLGAAIQVEASNHRKLLWSKAMVVGVTEKAKQDFVRYVPMETNASEPLMKCRKHGNAIKTGRSAFSPGSVWRQPVYCPDGGRHAGGVNAAQASVRNVGTCP